jgi:site-specific recombinase XerD
LRRGGYPTRREAIAARYVLLGDGDTATAEGWTMQRWLRYWLTTRTKIRPTTLRSYEAHVENHLVPHLGRIRLSELTGRHITDMITTIGAATNRYGRPPTPSTLHRIRATLRSALNAAIREGLLHDNPARHVEVPSPRRPYALVWTFQRVEAWQQTGEAAGGRGVDHRADRYLPRPCRERPAGGDVVADRPPRRLIALDRHTVRLPREHRSQQRAERQAAGERWQDSGYVFVAEDGAPLHPDFLIRRFHHLVLESGLPPVRLQDLRHGAASLAHCAGVDLKTVQA